MSESSTIDWKSTGKPLTARQTYWKRRRKRDQALQVVPYTTQEPKVDRIIDAETLISTFQHLKQTAGQAPGPDGIGYGDWSASEVAQILRAFAKALKEGNYKPAPGMTIRIPKATSGFRKLTIRDLCYRVLAKSLNEALSPYWERIFLPGSFGYRPKLCALNMLASLEATMAAQNLRVLAIDDVRGAFDNVEIDRLMNYHRHHIQSNELLNVTELVIRGGSDRQIGIDQGSALSPTALNVYLHHLHDTQVVHYTRCSAWHRYADNLCYAVQSVQEGEQVLAQAAQLLQAGGLALKGQDGPPVDLRIDEPQLMGFKLSWGADRLKFGLGNSAWSNLSQRLLEAHETDNPPGAAIKVASGWIASFGPAFENSVVSGLQAQLEKILAEHGFREAISPQEIERQAKRAWQQWLRIRKDSTHAPIAAPVGV